MLREFMINKRNHEKYSIWYLGSLDEQHIKNVELVREKNNATYSKVIEEFVAILLKMKNV